MGNLGTLAMRQGDSQTAQACLEQHLQLTQQLGDWQGEINAWSKMAQLAASAAAAGGGAGSTGQAGEGTSVVSEGCEVEGGGGGGGIGAPHSDGVHVGDGAGGGDSPCGVDGGAPSAAVGNDAAVGRALWCFERAAALAKAHDEASDLGQASFHACSPRRHHTPTIDSSGALGAVVPGAWHSPL